MEVPQAVESARLTARTSKVLMTQGGVKVVCTGRQQGHQARKVRRLVTCMGKTVRGRLESRLHLHDDGFLGDFCLLLSDYKENSRNSNRYSQAAPGAELSEWWWQTATCLV